MAREIYLVLTQTNSLPCNLIKIYTHAEFNHISISLTPDLEPMYSFGRRLAYFPYWGGFVKEQIHAGTFHRFPRTKAVVLSLSVSEEIYDGLNGILGEMYRHKNKYGYNFIGVFLAPVKISLPRKRKFYCSEFIRTLFQKYEIPGSENLSLFAKPSDFLAFPGVQMTYRGLLKDFSSIQK